VHIYSKSKVMAGRPLSLWSAKRCYIKCEKSIRRHYIKFCSGRDRVIHPLANGVPIFRTRNSKP